MSRMLILAIGLAVVGSAEAQFPGFGGAPGGGSPGGRTRTGGSSSGGSGSSAALQAQSRVLAVADERSNSVIIIAPEDQLPMIEELMKELDTNVDDVTEVKVFKLVNADPTEMAEQLNQLFGSSTQGNSQQNQSSFGPGFVFGRLGGGAPQGNNSNSRGLRSDQKVVSVPDARTASLIVSAPRQMMPSIEQMVKQLDSSTAKRQNVFVYSLEYADVNNVATVLRGMFDENQRNLSSQQSQESALEQRRGTFGSAGASSGTIGATAGGGGGGAIGRR
ncbi:MAG: hypothetical protein ISQ14_01250 [Verrucomicrobiae bacterium]|nr:hypothetical protein [Verrucomicrobiae bacterium]